MAWTAANPVSIGDATKKAHYDVAFNNTVFNYFASSTIMLFGQNAAPTGWTRKADWQDNAMLCYASAGNIGSGGAVNPQSTHTHAGPSHAHAVNGLPAHASPTKHFAVMDGAPLYCNAEGAHHHGNSGAGGTAATGANTAPHYQEVIAATKD